MNPTRRWRWPAVLALLAMVAHLFMMMAPLAAQASAPAPGSLLHALSIICTPDGTSQLDDGEDAALDPAACDHCTLCFGLGTPLAPVARAVPIGIHLASHAFLPAPVDRTLIDTISHRPAERAPPASAPEHP